MQIINVKHYNINVYKTEIENFYNNLKSLVAEMINLNNTIPYLQNFIKDRNRDIINDCDLKNNKYILDTINTNFKNFENINNIIKKQLNTWKNIFVGKNGLDTLIKDKKEELLKKVKQKQIDYDNRIKENGTLKEQAHTKTILGVRLYKKINILNIDADILPREYFEINEKAIIQAIKNNNNINIIGVEYEIIEQYK